MRRGRDGTPAPFKKSSFTQVTFVPHHSLSVGWFETSPQLLATYIALWRCHGGMVSGHPFLNCCVLDLSSALLLHRCTGAGGPATLPMYSFHPLHSHNTEMDFPLSFQEVTLKFSVELISRNCYRQLASRQPRATYSSLCNRTLLSSERD